MKVAVWDTYVTKPDRTVMHFDIIVPEVVRDEKVIHTFGKDYLLSKQLPDVSLSTRECQFCHVERASPEAESSIQKKGYYIVEMENC
jgi:hypothetical protein